MDSSSASALEYGIAPPGFRLPAGTHIGRVRLQISDLTRSIAYYERVLGLRVLSRNGAVAVLGAQNDEHPLIELHEKPGIRPVPRRGAIGLYHFALLLPTRESLGAFVRHLGEIGLRAGMSDHFVSEAVYLSDPDGLGIEVYADRPRTQWRVDDGQVAMTTVPLDVDALLASAHRTPWEGAPAGTVVGHVHLYVRDVADAERFYHAGLGFDKIVWNYPGALFMSAGGYHHHLGTNTWAAGAAVATPDDARLIDWEVVVPHAAHLAQVSDSFAAAGFSVEREGSDVVARDPWGTQLRVVHEP